MKATTVLAAALAATLGYSASAQATIVDLFDDPASPGFQLVRDQAGVLTFNEYDGGPTIIGGSRDLIIQATSGYIPGVAGASLAVAGGQLRYSNDSGVTSNAAVQWDGNDNSADLNYGLNANLVNQEGCPASGCTQFVATVLEADLGFQFSLGVYTDASNWSVLTAVSLGVPSTSPELSIFPFAWWLLADGDYVIDGLPFNITSSNHLAGNDVDFEHVGALQFTITGSTANVDLRIDSINKVPEPGTLALLGIGILAGGLTGRRRMARKA